MSTSGYGGHSVRKIMKVHTNDPAQSLIRIELIGQVKTFVRLSPGHIELSGKAGQKITSTMTITPVDQEIDFKITQSTARDKQNIRFEIKRNDQDAGSPFYELIVENIKNDPGIYADLITIWTDTSRKIPIRVFGNITQ
ncbi:MAG: hypothetical protein A2277_20590 [Desulfobacterales bacterium RIFOXYA12_FULL_46_15]|nr:MAG: hypothetical protein A2277_20590 [Desulfobacterales bacterium RIFOXYA12_FULL_46_15]